MKRANDEDKKQWTNGFVRNFITDEYKKIPEKYKDMNWYEYCEETCDYYADINENDYMPVWAEEEKTHIQMYETCSEGTPISPKFTKDKTEELAKWLADNNASSFGIKSGVEICNQ